MIAITPTTNTITVGPRGALSVRSSVLTGRSWAGERQTSEWSGQCAGSAHGHPMAATVRVHDQDLELTSTRPLQVLRPDRLWFFTQAHESSGRDHIGHSSVIITSPTSSDGELPPIRTTGLAPGREPMWPMRSRSRLASALIFLTCRSSRHGARIRAADRTFDCVLAGLAVDLQPAGWRLTDASSRDHRLAISTLRSDLDMLEELAQGYENDQLSVAAPDAGGDDGTSAR